jgi:hypothetical protein
MGSYNRSSLLQFYRNRPDDAQFDKLVTILLDGEELCPPLYVFVIIKDWQWEIL